MEDPWDGAGGRWRDTSGTAGQLKIIHGEYPCPLKIPKPSHKDCCLMMFNGRRETAIFERYMQVDHLWIILFRYLFTICPRQASAKIGQFNRLRSSTSRVMLPWTFSLIADTCGVPKTARMGR